MCISVHIFRNQIFWQMIWHTHTTLSSYFFLLPAAVVVGGGFVIGVVAAVAGTVVCCSWCHSLILITPLVVRMRATTSCCLLLLLLYGWPYCFFFSVFSFVRRQMTFGECVLIRSQLPYRYSTTITGPMYRHWLWTRCRSSLWTEILLIHDNNKHHDSNNSNTTHPNWKESFAWVCVCVYCMMYIWAGCACKWW